VENFFQKETSVQYLDLVIQQQKELCAKQKLKFEEFKRKEKLVNARIKNNIEARQI